MLKLNSVLYTGYRLLGG